MKYNQRKRKDGGHGDQKSECQNDLPIQADLLATEYGVSPATVKRAGKTAELLDAHPEEREEVIKKRKRIRNVKKDLKKAVREKKRREAEKKAPKLDSRILVGDFRKISSKIQDGSVSLIFTDPPYDKKASMMLSEFAEFSRAPVGNTLPVNQGSK